MSGTDVLVVEPNRTVRRIVERTLRAEGYVVRTAADGTAALGLCGQAIPALLLVDAVVSEALVAHPSLRGVPVVTTGVRAPVRALGETDPRDPLGRVTATLAKPFGPETLVETLAGTLARSAGRSAARGTSETGTDGAPTRERVPLSGQDEGDHGLAPDDALAGRLEHVPLPDVLQLLATQRQTGTLEVRGGETSVAIGLTGGKIDLVLGRGLAGTGTRLGRFLLELELVSREHLAAALASQRVQRGREARRDDTLHVGALLVGSAVLTEEGRRSALLAQSLELLVEALRASRGTFRFRRGHSLPEAAEARLGLGVAGVLLDAVRRVDEWRLAEARLETLDAVLEPVTSASRWLDPARPEDGAGTDASLDADDRAVLETADGARTLRAIARVLDREEASALASARRLVAMRALGLGGEG